MTTSHITDGPEFFTFEVPSHKSTGSKAVASMAPVHLSAPVAVTDAEPILVSGAPAPGRRRSAKTHAAFVVAGVIALASGTATLVIAALAVR